MRSEETKMLPVSEIQLFAYFLKIVKLTNRSELAYASQNNHSHHALRGLMSPKFFILVLFTCTIFANTAKAQPASLDATISALYESITFDQNSAPDYEKFRSLFVDGAFLISVKDSAFFKLSTEEFIQNMTKQRESGNLKAFREFEISRESNRYGNIAHVFSTYETDIQTAEGPLKTRGINSIQLLRINDQWKVTSLIWYEENGHYPLPDKYLPEKGKETLD
jgi:hypothetical protein